MKEVESKKSHLQEEVDQLNEDCARLKAQGITTHSLTHVPISFTVRQLYMKLLLYEKKTILKPSI